MVSELESSFDLHLLIVQWLAMFLSFFLVVELVLDKIIFTTMDMGGISKYSIESFVSYLDELVSILNTQGSLALLC